MQNQPRGLLQMRVSRHQVSQHLRMPSAGDWSLRSLRQIFVLYGPLLDSYASLSKILSILRICDSGSGTAFAVDKIGNFQQII